MHVGNLIKKHRENQNLSMNFLARMAEVGQSSLSDIESCKRQPTFDLLEKLVIALGLSWTEFFYEEPSETTPELRRLLETIKDYTPEQLSSLHNFLLLIRDK